MISWKLLAGGITVPVVFLAGAALEKRPQKATGWDEVKRSQIPRCELPSEFGAPVRQPMSDLAWEDGVYISRDGLDLYCTYIPMDLLQYVRSDPKFEHLSDMYKYRRGPSLGQDYTNPIPGLTTPWIHGDVAMTERTSTSQPFGPWKLSRLRGRFFNVGGVSALASPTNSSRYDLVAYTEDSKNGPKIYLLTNVGKELAPHSEGKALPDNIDDPRYHADNPDIERPDPGHPERLVLFWDSDDRPGKGMRDIWFSTSEDGGKTWKDPTGSSLNTALDDEQPHLFNDGKAWWLYYTGSDPKDERLAIFRVKQETSGNWDRWSKPQMVVSAGTTAGVGEPTLTSNGDLSFVAVTHNEEGATPTDQYDCDPWFMPHNPGHR